MNKEAAKTSVADLHLFLREVLLLSLVSPFEGAEYVGALET